MHYLRTSIAYRITCIPEIMFKTNKFSKPKLELVIFGNCYNYIYYILAQLKRSVYGKIMEGIIRCYTEKANCCHIDKAICRVNLTAISRYG